MGLKQLCVVLVTLFLCNAVLSTPTDDVDAIGGLILQSLASMFSFNAADLPIPVHQVSNRRFARQIVLGARRQQRSGTAAVSWNSCGSRKDPMQLKKFELKPNPIKVPGPLRAEMALLVREPISAPIKVQVQVQKEVELPLGLGSTWLELPCPGNSCAVQDACASNILPREGSRCPAPRQLDNNSNGANKDNSTLTWRECNCPIPKGLYAMPPLEFNISSPSSLIPEYLLNGGFFVKIRLSRHKRRLACVETSLDLDL